MGGESPTPLVESISVPFVDPSTLPVREPRPGWRGRFFHSEHMTFAYYDIAEGADVHSHSHPNEEAWHIIAGALELTIAGETRTLHAGEAAIVPGGTEHRARAPEPARVIVVDHPPREPKGT